MQQETRAIATPDCELATKAEVTVTADSETWVKFLNQELSIIRAVVTGKIRIKGPAKLLVAFGKCFG